MSITAIRFATQIRTWLLIAALSALLIAIGGAIGGGALYLFVVLAVAMNVVGYWFSDKIALVASRARPGQAGRAARARDGGGLPRPAGQRADAAPVADPVRAAERVRHRP